MRFQYRCKNYLTLNQLTVVILYKSPVEDTSDVPTITEITDETFHSEKGYCHGVYVFLHFNNMDGVARKEEHWDTDPDTDEEDMEDVKLDHKRERHWRIVFEDNNGGVDNKKSILHAKRWDVYIN